MMYKITARLISGESADTIGKEEIEKVYKAKSKATLVIKVIYAKIFYDWVKVEVM